MRLARRTGVETFAMDDEAVVYDHARDTVHYLNRTARLVWDLCDGTRTHSVIDRELQNRFLTGEAQTSERQATITRGISEAIGLLCRDGLLELRNES